MYLSTDNHQPMTPRFLKFNCTVSKGHDRCRDCPLTPNDCRQFCEYIQGIQDNFKTKQAKEIRRCDSDEKITQDYRGIDGDTRDQLTPMKVALIAIEKIYKPDQQRHDFKAWIHSIVLKKELDISRTYDVRRIQLKEIMFRLEGCNVLVNNDELMNRKFITAYIPTLHKVRSNKVSGKSPSIKVVDIRNEEMLNTISKIFNIVIIVVGCGIDCKINGKDGFDNRLSYSNKLIENVKSVVFDVSGVLCWINNDISAADIVARINGMIRQYLNIQLSNGSGDVEKEEGEEREDVIHALPDPKRKQSIANRELENDFEDCFEQMFTKDVLKKCAAIFYYALTIEQELFRDFNSNDFYHENGEIKQERIYEQLARLLGISRDAAKRRYLRCREEGDVYRYLGMCLGG
ncbi:hypothetical protein [uncultured Desulfobulbus sp.]|uniref:hypothetical protein n=1 Tax=uncultured Desulfobulbus sp. TaxID=239745 RepID=UPI0029C747E3|nr:hypothetical protein [uncultured Desulfobulbus sp.]